MMLTNKEVGGSAPVIDGVDSLPLILALNSGGEALHWITYQDSAFYSAKGKILWSVGQYEVLLRGGINVKTGKQSTLILDTIVALDNGTSPTKYRRTAPALNNRELFTRDRNVCAYCATKYANGKLTRDHVHPKSKGGPDVWQNVVTACRSCNQRKDDRTPEQANMQLTYVPYVPSYHEALILKNRRILADQMEWLIKGVPRESRLHSDPLPVFGHEA
jgi:5-methylcytosine-specific restriction endonuclease McrA